MAFGGMAVERRERGRVRASRSRHVCGPQSDTMTIAARTIFSALLIACLTTPVVAADFPRKAPVKPAKVADRCAKVEPPKGTPEVPGGDIFGFTNPTDLGDPCQWYFASENTGLAGKRDGSFFALFTKSEVSYTYSENLAFAFSAFTAYNKWSNVTVLQDALASAGAGVMVTEWDKLQFDGLSGEVLLRLVKRSPGQPFALTVAMEPRWSRIDLATLPATPRNSTQTSSSCSSTWRSRSTCSPR